MPGMSREEMMRCGGLSEAELRELEEACGVPAGDAAYQERMGLAAALRQSGFTAEEVRAYFTRPRREERQSFLMGKRWEVVQEIHERQRRLGRIDYLLYLEGR